MPTIPNLSKLTLIETEPTGVGDLKRVAVQDGDGESQFTDLPPELGAKILEFLMASFDGPRAVCTALRDMMIDPKRSEKGPIGTLLGALATDPSVQEQLWRLAFLKYFGLPDPMLNKRLLWAKGPIGKLLGEDANDPSLQEKLWRLAFLKYFALPDPMPDPMVDEDGVVFANQTELNWAELFDRMCREMKLFEMVQSLENSIKLDWKNNASWTPYESDAMLAWVKRMAPTPEGMRNNRWKTRFSSPTMQVVLESRGASVDRQRERITNNKMTYNLLGHYSRFEGFLKTAEGNPDAIIDMSPPVAMGHWHDHPALYHTVITMLTRQMVNRGVVLQENIKKSYYPKVMQTLVEKMGASPNIPAEDNFVKLVPLCAAISHGDHVAVVDMLMELGASTEPDLPVEEPTPLMVACSHDVRISCAKALLGWGADVNASRHHGRTPLSIACRHCMSVELVKMLLDNNADPMPHTRSDNANDPRHREYRRHPLAMTEWASGAPTANRTQIKQLLGRYEASTVGTLFVAESDDVRRQRHRDRKQQAVFFKKEDV